MARVTIFTKILESGHIRIFSEPDGITNVALRPDLG